MPREHRKSTVGEEIANSVTHGIGAILSKTALVLLVVWASFTGDPWRIVSVSIFGASLVFLYLTSTLYHAFPWPKVKRVFHSLDHAAIYLLIAGTYTPFLLVSLRGPWGWSLFGVIWGATLTGCILKIFFVGHWKLFSTLIYVLMGWAVIIALKPTIASVPPGGLLLLLIGGLCYTGGVLFYLWERLPYHHAIWHIFVLGGSATHFFAVFFFVIPMSALS